MLKYKKVLNESVQNPPTEEEMKRLRRVAMMIDIGGPALLFISFAAIVLTTLTYPAWMAHLMLLMFLELVGVGIWGFFILNCPPIPFRLKKYQCGIALRTFEQTPEGIAYLNKIRDMAREVWTFDVAAAEAWAYVSYNADYKATEEEACRRLYGIEAR